MNRISSCLIVTAVLLSATASYGKAKHHKSQPVTPEDQIEVLAHLPATGGAITRFFETQHYRRQYLYAEHASSKSVTLIDVTKLSEPAVLAEVAFPAGASDNLVAVTGNAALVSTQAASNLNSASPQTFRIMSFADPLHPAVKQQFNNVTAMARDDKRGLIFLANDAGIWILQQRYAQDPEEEKEWEHMMLGAR